MKKMFTSDELQMQFEEKGYVIVPFFTSEEIKQMLDYYESVKNKHEVTSPVHSTSDTNNPDLIKEVDEKLKSFSSKKCEEIFFECKTFLSNILIKENGEDSEINAHQDWTYVDESRYASVSVWCPLTDINETTGRISVLPGSHRFIETLRASPDSPSAFSHVEHLLEQFMQPLNLKAGEALIYNHALIHSSKPNLSGKQRPAIVLAVVPQEAELFMHYYHPAAAKRKLEKFLVNTEFFYRYAKHSRPSGVNSLGFIDYTFQQIAVADFYKKMSLIPPQSLPLSSVEISPQKNLLKRITQFFLKEV
jgi:hypothetical protein